MLWQKSNMNLERMSFDFVVVMADLTTHLNPWHLDR
jgi:hypothetical protein